jgi:hypothetical protein
MDSSEIDKEEKIIAKLFVKEEDTIKKLDNIVTRLSKFIKIEEGTGKIVILEKNLTIEQKVFLTLVGKYFYDKVKKEGEGELDLATISKTIDKPITSLPIFIQRLLNDGFITRISRGKYKVNYYKIEEFLEKFEHRESDESGINP